MVDMQFVEKYRPKSLSGIAGQDKAVEQIKAWLKNWRGGALLLFGPTGSGKTVIAEALAKENKFELIELNASDSRNAEIIQSVLGPASKQASIFGKQKLLLIDEVDGLSGGDRGGATAIIKIIKESKFPVMLTANNLYSAKLKPLRSVCSVIQLKKISTREIEKRLKEICEKEGIEADENVLKLLSLRANGDMRSAINDLESLGRKITAEMVEELGWRERKKNIFDVLKIIFKTKNIKTALQALSESEKSLEDVFWWVEENVAEEYEKPEEIARAFDFLSKADLFRGRIIKNQNYRMLVHMQSLLAAIALAKNKPYYKFVGYKPPQRLLILGRSKAARQKVDTVAKNLGKRLHCSKKTIKTDLPLLKIILKDKRWRKSVEESAPEIKKEIKEIMGI